MPWILKLNKLFSRRWRGRRLRKQKKDSKSESKDTAIKRKGNRLPVGKRWRNCSDFDSWLRETYMPLDGACIRDFKASYNPPNRGFPEWIQHRAEQYMVTLQELLQQAGIKGIQWFKFPIADESVDELVRVFGLLLRETLHMPPLDSHRLYFCYKTMREYLPDPVLLVSPALDTHNQSLCVAEFGKEEPIAVPTTPRFGSHWRNCRTVDDFARLFNLDDDAKGYIAPPGSKIKPDLPAWLKEGAEEYLDVVLRFLKKGEWEGIHYSRAAQVSRDDENALIHIYVELMKISPYFEMQRLSSYHEALLRLLPIWHRPPVHKWKPALFPNRSLHDVTWPLYGEILRRFQEFNIHRNELYRGVAPFTALVGPEKYGKSFFVQQMALQGYTYVVYLLLQTDKAYLQWRSPEDHTLAKSPCEGLPNRQRILECFIAVNLVNVKLCRDVGICPRAFFDMQTQIPFNNLFEEFKKMLWQAFESLTQAVHRVTERLRPPGRRDEDDKYWNQALKYCLGKYAALMWRKFFTLRAVLPIYQGYHDCSDRPSDTALKEGSPAMVLCIDEQHLNAAWLPNKERKLAWYNEMIKATSTRVKHQWDAPEDRFFALFVHRESSDMPPKPYHPFPDIQIEHLK
ncbi:uncharacterized protein CDV56_106615 [Aspergillus thermomutatus]|uniref:Uncharacterized protein n=1 Tax=Aspergillus thermomutatus TaxID=41047 RepID=A0A397HQL3_ASPTH|nr:uncharacterized protein CDV56_106615 [Aspergillus thermomutatus]RHZ63594.1 hypothetical protein CDV56_106615 [Aspergillus thermomutatus]